MESSRTVLLAYATSMLQGLNKTTIDPRTAVGLLIVESLTDLLLFRQALRVITSGPEYQTDYFNKLAVKWVEADELINICEQILADPREGVPQTMVDGIRQSKMILESMRVSDVARLTDVIKLDLQQRDRIGPQETSSAIVEQDTVQDRFSAKVIELREMADRMKAEWTIGARAFGDEDLDAGVVGTVDTPAGSSNVEADASERGLESGRGGNADARTLG